MAGAAFRPARLCRRDTRPHVRGRRFAPLLSSLLMVLGACTAGPDYERPQVAGEAGSWSAPQADAAFAIEPWRQMGDPLLVELIERGARTNLDLAEAEARLREARALRDAAAGRALPEASASASASERKLSKNGEFPFSRIPPPYNQLAALDRTFSLFDAGFDASWEIDLWGGQRRAVEAAAWQLQAREANVREVRLRVVAEIARAYADLRRAQAQSALLVSEAENRLSLASLTRQLYESGEVGRTALSDAEAETHRAQAAIPAADAGISAAMNAIAVLIAEPPEALRERLAKPADFPELPGEIGAGLRSDVLERRPDVMIAEATLAAATAETGVARAQMFPQLTLIGSVGIQSRSFEKLDAGDSLRFGVGPSLHWPIFSGGRIRANIRAADARAEAAAAAYVKSVLSALSDSETALNRYNSAIAAARELDDAKDRLAQSAAQAQQRYRAGEDSLIDVQQARARYNAAALAAVEARGQALEAHARLVKALGGGWDENRAEERKEPAEQ